MAQTKHTRLCTHCGVNPIGPRSKTGLCRSCGVSIAKSGIDGRSEPGPNPSGLCMCGCGEPAPLARWNRATKGEIAGKPLRYIPGHKSRVQTAEARKDIAPPNPPGLCMCGCGRPTPIAKQSHRAMGNVKGEHVRYLPGHNTTIRSYTVNHDTGCWIWDGRPQPLGYGTTKLNGRTIPAHQYVYEKIKGPVPEGLILDHLCRNPRCVNPDHLEPVTHAENIRRGNATKITWAIALHIRDLRRSMTIGDICRKLDLSRDIVADVVNGNTWRESE